MLLRLGQPDAARQEPDGVAASREGHPCPPALQHRQAGAGGGLGSSSRAPELQSQESEIIDKANSQGLRNHIYICDELNPVG